MESSRKTKVIVLYGGRSTEHEVSCRSAAFLLKNLDQSKYDLLAVGIDKEGVWWPQDCSRLLEKMTSSVPLLKGRPPDTLTELLSRVFPKIGTPLPYDPNFFDGVVIFPVLHGGAGENGSLQGLFEMAGVAYVGPDRLASSICMDKLIAKQLVEAAGIPVVPYLVLRKGERAAKRQETLREAALKLGDAWFVKPASLGSSVGVSRAHDWESLNRAVQSAFEFDEKILIEQAMEVREIEFAALGGYEPEFTNPGEVISEAGGFYSYDEKYSDQSHAQVVVPALLEPSHAEEGIKLCRRIYGALQLHGMVRIDLFLTKNGGRFYFNEANTIPGLTNISQYPLLWKQKGVEARELLDRLIQAAMERRALQKELRAVL